MKNTFLVSYDLGVPESSDDYKKVTDYLKSFSLWARPLQSLWFVVSDSDTASNIRDSLNGITDTNDKILVMKVTGDAWATSRLSSKINGWMKDNI